MTQLHLIIGTLEAIFGGLVFYGFNLWRRDLKLSRHYKRRILTRVLIGAGVGYAWISLGMPNSFNTFMAGAFGPEIADGLLSKYQERYPELFNEDSMDQETQ